MINDNYKIKIYEYSINKSDILMEILAVKNGEKRSMSENERV